MPVSPAVVEVPDLAAACAALGLPAPPEGTKTAEIELLPGCPVTVAEVDGPPTPFIYVCVRDLVAARKHIAETFGVFHPGPDSVDPDTFRLRGCILSGGGMVIDAVHCPIAEEAGVPCTDGCNPFLSFV